MNNYFTRTEILLGKDNLEKIKKASVAIVGLGAVGSHAMEALCRLGVKNFILADFDIIQDSNINRNLLALNETIGRDKVEVAKERCLMINPECNIESHKIFVNENSFDILFKNKIDVLIDAIDSLSPKVALINECVVRGVRIVSSMGAARKKDPSRIFVADISETNVCNLARLVRKKLRKYGVNKGVRCIYSREVSKNSDYEFREKDDNDYYDYGRKRPVLGSASYLTGIFGYYAASETVKIILETD